MLLKIALLVKHVKNHVRYDYERSTETFPGEMAATKRIATDYHPSEEISSLPVRITH